MKLSALVLLQAAASVLAKAPYCHYKGVGQIYIGGQPIPVNNRYTLAAYDVNDHIPTVCHDLWMELRNKWMCGVWSFGRFKHYCRDAGDGMLEWEFESGLACNKGMVHDAWYKATKNKYGAIDCEKKKN
ncbi:hypothetical protein CkaCkLH20_06771 [Colletotrichum karsti]|uniref:Uncharacterized protein n=1 Tax=Colletotrichum karsti TaxID=1095194 RepID=A0A9P6I412_9PEZI|nr:uncharacterized protein CkaCkLH20_06771 [Colletotrichum karsti]KAF9875839.1 hypothetical protein CkaCkLH20_06771 [Colletotrichum karsti]